MRERAQRVRMVRGRPRRPQKLEEERAAPGGPAAVTFAAPTLSSPSSLSCQPFVFIGGEGEGGENRRSIRCSRGGSGGVELIESLLVFYGGWFASQVRALVRRARPQKRRKPPPNPKKSER